MQYKFYLHRQNDDSIKSNFGYFSWFDELMKNVDKYKEFSKSDSFKLYESKMESRWFSSSPNKVQSDIYDVYVKALHASTDTDKELNRYYLHLLKTNQF